MAIKNVIVDVLKGEKLDSDNYNIWRNKIQYLFNVDDTMLTISERKDPAAESASVISNLKKDRL